MDLSKRHPHPIPLGTKQLGPISDLAPFSALIISLVLVIFFLVRFYVLEGFLIRRLYGSIYTEMSELNRRGFVNHHIAGVTKVIILVVAAYPFISVAFCKGPSFNTPFVKGSVVTLGDMLIVVAQILIGIYIFELIYRVKLSPVAVMHHVGTIFIGQAAIAISLRPLREPDTYIEFVLCTVWGEFMRLCSRGETKKILTRFGLRRIRRRVRAIPPLRHHPLPGLPKTAPAPEQDLPHLLLLNRSGDTHRDGCDDVVVWKHVGPVATCLQGCHAGPASGILRSPDPWQPCLLADVPPTKAISERGRHRGRTAR